MLLGFTGTQLGMTDTQRSSVLQFLRDHEPSRVFHGMCVGADADFHRLVRDLLPDTTIVGVPCDILSKRADVQCDIVRPARPPLLRNRDIVACCDMLIACPKEITEQTRSGTWATVRLALKSRKPIHIFYPK
jgi:hypothetical protein